MKDRYAIMYIFAAGMFMLITAPALWSEGMFMDGLFYASVAHNMANGLGSFWTPFFSETMLTRFYEHPPLAMGIQSLFFSVFGDSTLIERGYSLLVVALTGFMIVRIWKEITGTFKNGWFPLLLWASVNVVSWSCANNMLENTMTLFILLSVFYYLRSRKTRTGVYLLISGLFLSAAVLTKGFVVLYIWAFPFFFLVFNKDKFSKILMQSFALVFYTSAPIALFYFFNEEAATNIIYYFRNQVQGSIENVETVNSRFAILWEFVQQALPILFIAAIGILGVKLKKHKISDKPEKISWVLLAITFSGILPIMISMKQRGFYIVSVYPLFALAIALIMLPYFKVQMAGIQKKRYFRRWIQIISVISIIAAIFLSIISAHTIQKDKEKILIVAITSKLTSKGSTIQICPEMRQDWSLNAYFVRYANIYLDPREESDHFLFLTDDSCTESIPHGYVISDGTGKYQLYRKTTE